MSDNFVNKINQETIRNSENINKVNVEIAAIKEKIREARTSDEDMTSKLDKFQEYIFKTNLIEDQIIKLKEKQKELYQILEEFIFFKKRLKLLRYLAVGFIVTLLFSVFLFINSIFKLF